MPEPDLQRHNSDSIALPTGVSVIIPCYNGARFLADAIDSAIQQTHPCVEIIVVDDGSTDSTPEITHGYGNRVGYIFQTNAGLSAARNTGIKAATYPLVSFLDADDRLLPHTLESMVRALENLPPDFAIVACHPESIDKEGKLMPQKARFALYGGEVTAEDLIQKSRFPCNVVVRRNIFFECGFFDAELKSSEDRDMWIRIASRYRIQLLPERLAQIRRHADNMSKNAVRQSRSIRMVLRKAFQSSAAPRWRPLFWARAWSIYFFQSGLMFAEAGASAPGAGSLFCSLCLWPCFLDPGKLGQPPLFRVRRLLRIAVECLAPSLMRRRNRIQGRVANPS